jgi:hypothetical protein
MSITTFIFAILLLGFMGFFGVLGFIAYASKQSYDNPLRVVMGAVASRILVTLGVSIIDIPMTAIEPIGGVMDVASLGLLAWYWATGFREMLRAFDPPKSLPPTV